MATIAPEDQGGIQGVESSMSTMAWPPVNLMPKSLHVFSLNNPLRKQMIALSRPNGWFDKFILFCIVANSLVMAATDYSNIEGMRGGTSEDDRYEPDTQCDNCATNLLISRLEPVFNIIFIVECLAKIIAFGFISGRHAYIKDSWNKLDFFVVLISILGMIPGLPNLSVLRTFRVLRPLRSLARAEGLKKIIGAVLDSIPDLYWVIVLLCFVLLVFSIAGLVFWNGILHARCRITPFPIMMPDVKHGHANATCYSVEQDCWGEYMDEVFDWYQDNYPPYNSSAPEYSASADPYRCMTVDNEPKWLPNDDSVTDETSDEHVKEAWNVDTSPWAVHGPLDCIWPLDNDDTRVCSLSGSGLHNCGFTADRDFIATCGSNFDPVGNPRFIDSYIPYGHWDPSEPNAGTGMKRMVDGEFTGDLNYGYTSYDNIFRAFTTTFQACSMEGWTDILYQTMDAWSVVPSVLIFVLLVLVGGNIVLNLVLAVVSESIETMNEEMDAEKEAAGIVDEPEVEEEEPTAEELEKYTGLKKLVKNPLFGRAIMACIFLNTIVLATDHVGIEDNEGLTSTLDLINTILTFVFLGEMLLNMAGLGLKEYFSEYFNWFDAIIVVFSMFDFIMASTSSGEEGGGGGAVSALRGARLLRILKMAKEWKTMQTLLKLIAKTVMEIGNFGVLLILFIFIYSLCGMQFFSNRMVFDENDAPVDIKDYERWQEFFPDRPRSHFDDIVWAMVTVFQILTGENWNACMYDGWRCSTIPELAILFYLSLVIFGAFIVMNLFLAILLSNFEGNDDLVAGPKESVYGEVEFDPDLTIENIVMAKDVGSKWLRKKSAANAASVAPDSKPEESKPEESKLEPEAAAENTGEEQKPSVEVPYVSLYIFQPDNAIRIACKNLSENPNFDKIVLVCILVSSLGLALDNPLSNRDSAFNAVLNLLDLIFSIIFIFELITKVISLGFVKHEGAYLRDAWNCLDCTIVLISILSMAEAVPGGSLKALRTLRVLRPLRMIKRFPELQLVVNALVSSVPGAANVMVVSCLFLLLFAILGVNMFKGTFNTCVGDVGDVWEGENSDVLQGFVDQYPEYEYKFFTDLNETYPEFADLFGACPDVLEPPSNKWKYPNNKLTSKIVCHCLYGEDAWEAVTPQNFDNVGLAFNLLFEITTTEGWVDVMYAGVDQMGQDMNHRRDDKKGNIAFFILFMLIGAFFVMELFVGVVIDNFNNLREAKGGGNIFMTDEQQEWAKTQALITRIKPEKRIAPPKGGFSLWCYNFVMPGINPKFEQFIMSCIVANSLVMAMQHHGQSRAFDFFIDGMNYAFAAIFTIEAILKLCAMGTKYFRDAWNKFDFTVVCGTNVGIAMFLITGSGVGPVASIVRMFRIGRLIRLINSAKELRKLFNTLISSVPAMLNIGFLLSILFFIFSVMGVQSYGKIHLGAGAGDMSEHANFHSMLESFLLLFRFSTGENWNGYMHSLMSDNEGCEPDHDKVVYNDDSDKPFCVSELDYSLPGGCKPIDGCGSGAAIPPVLFFYMFTLMVSFVMFNLFVGVVLDAFDNNEEGEILGPEDLDNFTETWSQFDPEATWYIKVSDLKKFVDLLAKPMGFGKEYEASDQELLTRMRETGMWDIPFVQDQEGPGGAYKDVPVVHITHVASAMAKRIVKEKQGDSFKELHGSHPVSKQIASSTRKIDTTVGDIFLTEAKENMKKQGTLEKMFPALSKSPASEEKKELS